MGASRPRLDLGVACMCNPKMDRVRRCLLPDASSSRSQVGNLRRLGLPALGPAQILSIPRSRSEAFKAPGVVYNPHTESNPVAACNREPLENLSEAGRWLRPHFARLQNRSRSPQGF